MKIEIKVCPNCLHKGRLSYHFLLPKCKKFITICEKCAENFDFDNISEETENNLVNNIKTIEEKINNAIDKLFN